LARESARRNIAAFEKLDLDAILINAAGCGSTLKSIIGCSNMNPHGKNGPTFSNKVLDLTEVLAAAQVQFQVRTR